MIAAEGEEVPFQTPIILASFPRVNDWLAQVERSMRISLAVHLRLAVSGLAGLLSTPERPQPQKLLQWLEAFPAQLTIVASQVLWTRNVSEALESGKAPMSESERMDWTLGVLADAVVGDLPVLLRRKCEHLITELVHQRDVVRGLVANDVTSLHAFEWLYHMRYYLDDTADDPVRCLTVEMADASFSYGFEYLGVPDRLVQTPLTDKCFLTLTQALNNQLGGSPFGPAGTGEWLESLVNGFPV
jgi:dynein heavy chain 1